MRRTATLPSLRVDPQLRKAAERLLEPGESLSAFVESAVRERVNRREEQNAFIARGLASLHRARRTGRFLSSEDVLTGLEEKLAAAKKRLKARR